LAHGGTNLILRATDGFTLLHFVLESEDELIGNLLQIFGQSLPKMATLSIFDVGIASAAFEVQPQKNFKGFGIVFADFYRQSKELFALISQQSDSIFEYLLCDYKHILPESFEAEIVAFSAIVEILLLGEVLSERGKLEDQVGDIFMFSFAIE
jgi:hypothetical protein